MFFYDLFRSDPKSRSVRQGEALFAQGDGGECMYVLINGRASIRIGEQVVERMLPGGIVGELAMLDEYPRSATVIADTDCEFVEVDRMRFYVLVKESPKFAIEVMRVMAQRQRNADLRLEA